MTHRPIGRPKTDIEKKAQCITLPVTIIKKLENYCDKTGKNRSQITTELFEIFFEHEDQTKMMLQYELKDAEDDLTLAQNRVKLIEQKLGEIEQKENDKIVLDKAQEKEKLEKIQAEIKESFKPELLIGKERFGIKITREMITAIRGT